MEKAGTVLMEASDEASESNARYTRLKTQKVLHGTVYCESSGFSPGVLPTKKDIIQSMIYLLAKARAGTRQRTVQEAARLLAYVTMEHWEFCTAYTVKVQHIQKKVLKLYNTFKEYVQTRAAKQTSSWISKVDTFNKDVEELFDICVTDDGSRMKVEEKTGVPMGPDEFLFIQDQRTDRKMYCEDFVDRVW